METVDLTDIEPRPQRYWNADGLPELMVGLLWMIWGSAWLVGARGAGWESANWLFVLIGVASVGVGATRLALFMRSNPRPVESA